MNDDHDSGRRISRIKAFILWGCVVWTVISAASLIWNILYTQEQTLAKANVMARLAYEKDLAFRSWVTSHGGVYVPVTAETPPNPYLHVPDRDQTTRSGKALTLMNPAYVMRQYYETIADQGGVKGHITSLNLLRPENKPDPWEEQALRSFETGKQEATVIQTQAGKEYVRLMKPLVTTKGCLKCHAAQGYKEGDVRGGISVSVPIAPLRTIEKHQIAVLSRFHASFWMLGFAVILLFGKKILKSETSRMKAEQDLRLSKEKLAKVFQASPDWITITTLEEGRYIDVNDVFLSATGYGREEVIGKSAIEIDLLIDPEMGAKGLRILRDQGKLHDFEVDLRMKSGKIRTVLWSAEKIELEGQSCRVNAVKDITIRKELEREIKRIAYHDHLTGLPNRMLLMDRLSMAMAQADRSRKKVAVMMLDLDKFKEINDTFGHLTGDLLLQSVAKRLTDIVRQGDTVARFGGDEFFLVLPEQKIAQGALEVAQKVVIAFQDAFDLDGLPLTVTTSIGIALYPDHGADSEALMKHADSAMYKAKAAGRNRYCMYEPPGSP